MAASSHRQDLLDTIASLAEQIARTSPECADMAVRIIDLVRELGAGLDPATIEDAISAETIDSDLSEPQVRAAARAIVEALRDDGWDDGREER